MRRFLGSASAQTTYSLSVTRRPQITASYGLRTPFRTVSPSIFQSVRPYSNDGPPPQGFIPAFINSIRRQIKENKDLQGKVKQLNAETNQLLESEAMQSAKKAMEKGAEATSRVTAAVGEVVHKVAENPVVKKTAETVVDVSMKVGETMQKVAEPIVESEAAKTIAKGVKNIADEVVQGPSNPRYIEYKPKDVREAVKQERLAREAAANPFNQRLRNVTEDLNAGSAVVTHKQTKWQEAWNTFKESNPVAKRMLAIRREIDESENPIIDRFRDIFASPVFQESQQAKVVKAFQIVDPFFNMDRFQHDAVEFIIPDIMEAYLRGDSESLAEWCSERAHAMLTRGFDVQQQHGLISDSKMLDIRRFELVDAKLIEDFGAGGELPVLTFRFTTQQVLLFRNVKGEVVLGREDKIEHSAWVIVFTKDQCIDSSLPLNPKTNSWRVLEILKADSWESL
ncbi:hypothetical protein BJ742DRAFT_783043 [Cladochytrium replicatum]|nr:hypothetical protein BJ742DRAFT_783043 [Cladochytrium replicatum]